MPRPVDFDALRDAFLSATTAANPTAKTPSLYLGVLNELGDWLADLPARPVVSREATGAKRALVVTPGAVAETGDLTEDHLRCHVIFLQNRPQRPGGRGGSVDRSHKKLSPNTVNNHWRAISSFVGWMVRTGEFPSGYDPRVNMVSPALVENPVASLTVPEMSALVATCGTGRNRSFIDVRDEAILRTFFEAGARRSEVATALVEALDLDRGILHVDGCYVKVNEGKQIPLSTKTRLALSKYLIVRARHKHTKRPELWLAQKGALSAGGMYQMIVSRGAQAGIKVHPHMLRHTFANVFLDAGGEEADLKRLGGWSSDRQVRHYSKARATQRAHAAHARFAIGDQI